MFPLQILLPWFNFLSTSKQLLLFFVVVIETRQNDAIPDFFKSSQKVVFINSEKIKTKRSTRPFEMKTKNQQVYLVQVLLLYHRNKRSIKSKTEVSYFGNELIRKETDNFTLSVSIS